MALPLEILAAGDFEPHYRVPLDVQGGELPVSACEGGCRGVCRDGSCQSERGMGSRAASLTATSGLVI